MLCVSCCVSVNKRDCLLVKPSHLNIQKLNENSVNCEIYFKEIQDIAKNQDGFGLHVFLIVKEEHY